MTGVGGVSFAHGRESRDEYNESLAGVNYQDATNESFDKQGLSVDAQFPNGTLLRGISAQPLQPAGSADDRLMAFSYFPCVTSNASNAVPYPRPDRYDPDDFTLLQRQIDGVVANGRYPNGPDLSYFSESHAYDPPSAEKLLLCCGVGPVNCDDPDANAGWATANYTERLRIAADIKYYLLGACAAARSLVSAALRCRRALVSAALRVPPCARVCRSCSLTFPATLSLQPPPHPLPPPSPLPPTPPHTPLTLLAQARCTTCRTILACLTTRDMQWAAGACAPTSTLIAATGRRRSTCASATASAACRPSRRTTSPRRATSPTA